MIPATSHFQRKKSLHPNEVYCAALGALAQAGYRLEQIIVFPDAAEYAEAARVYSKEGRLTILHYPGKDNQKPQTPDHPVVCLQTIYQTTAHALQAVPASEQERMAAARKLFIVAESNRWGLFPVRHYIKAELTAGVLVTEDSKDRNYDERQIETSLPHTTRTPAIKRGWQGITDDWSCGHYVLRALHRSLNDLAAPASFAITDTVIEEHAAWYEQGHTYFQQAKDDAEKAIRESKADIVVWSDDEFVSEAEEAATASATKSPGFFQRHPWFRDALIVAGVVLLSLAVTAVVIGTSGAGLPAVLGVGATIGAVVHLSGIAGIAVGLASLCAGSVAFFAIVTGGISALVRKIAGDKSASKSPTATSSPRSTDAKVITDLKRSSSTSHSFAEREPEETLAIDATARSTPVIATPASIHSTDDDISHLASRTSATNTPRI